MSDSGRSERQVVRRAQRWVVKVGSSLVTDEGRGIDPESIAMWAAQIAGLRAQAREVVLVSSGAIAEGMKRLGWMTRPHEIHELQAAAAVGQMGLAQAYESGFAKWNLKTAQILLTHEDIADRRRYLNARSTISTLLGYGVVPIINENDTVVTDEIKLGDNDTLAAMVTNLIEADVLVILTDQAGLFTADPRRDSSATLITWGQAADPRLESMAGGAGSGIGKGGMATKVRAAQRAARSGAATVIASGRESNVLSRLASGESVGTCLVAELAPMAARKQWLADQLQTRGRLILDAGAVRVLMEQGKSLLPIGVTELEGDFERGDLVTCLAPDGKEVARGLVNYGASDARRILRRPSSEIESILGFVEEPELIHRDNLILLDRS
ncbi:MAG: glutamate 5-kinase [Burkholderiaceae bacterium]|nr:glutamate 5-kinase [Burkholderiaceae bacterium]